MNLSDELAIRENPWRGRAISLGGLVALVAVIGIGTFALFFRGSEEALRETEDVVVGRATINANLIVSGIADAQLLSDLTFRSSGRVETISVKVGDEVRQGDVLASLEADELTNAVSSAQANLALAQARMQAVLDGATDAELAAVEQAVVSAEGTVGRALRDLQDLLNDPTEVARSSEEQGVVSAVAALNQAIRDRTRLLDGPTRTEIASANQVVISAEAALAQAERDRTTLLGGPTATQVAAAEQAVASAQASFNLAERNLTELRDGPTAAQLAAVEQAVAAAESNLASAQAALDRLTAPPSAADLAAAEQALANAVVNLENTTTNNAATEAALRAAIATYCEEEPLDIICPSPPIPLSAAEVDALLDDITDPATDPLLLPFLNGVIQANASYQVALNVEETAAAAVVSAEANLAAVLDGPDALDVDAAAAAVTAAAEGLALAELNLTEVAAGASAEDIANAEDTVTAARASLDAAITSQVDLLDGPDADDIARADDAVLSAHAVLDAAVANQEDLLDGADDADIARADDAVRSAQAAYDAAVARRADVLDGADASDIASARDGERLAEASLDSARENRDETRRGAEETRIEQERQSVRSASLAVEAAQIRMRNAQIISPFDGTVAAINITPGEFAGTASVAAIVLLTPDALVLRMQIGETDYPNVKLDQTGVVLFDALPGRPFPFRIIELGLSPSSAQGVVTYQVSAALTIPPDGPRPSSGMSAAGQIVTESKVDVIAVPLRAIRRSGGNQIVDLREGGTVVERPVTTGASDNNFVEIVEGLEEGDVIVIPRLVTGRSADDAPDPTLPAGIR